MKPYFLSLLAGMLAGAVYGAISVRSPAPPIVALMGLLGMLAGEQILPIVRRLLSGIELSAAWHEAQCSRHMFGSLPRNDASDVSRRDRQPS
jgi:XapX domain-containing protein